MVTRRQLKTRDDHVAHTLLDSQTSYGSDILLTEFLEHQILKDPIRVVLMTVWHKLAMSF